MDRREQNIRVFFDTENWMRSTEKLRRAVRRSRQGSRLILPEEEIVLTPGKADRAGIISVTEERTGQAVRRLAGEFPQSRICILNFASATTPGGGVRHGSSAQEESLCRISTLYGVLPDPVYREAFYEFHRKLADPRYTDACIYTPDIVICKSDTAVPERLPEEEWKHTDVITCAAPNLRPAPDVVPVSAQELYDIQLSRARRILAVAAGAGADVFVGGAFGCGAFRNDPEVVADAWHEAVKDFGRYFDRIVFAVFCPPSDRHNYEAFSSRFSEDKG